MGITISVNKLGTIGDKKARVSNQWTRAGSLTGLNTFYNAATNERIIFSIVAIAGASCASAASNTL